MNHRTADDAWNPCFAGARLSSTEGLDRVQHGLVTAGDALFSRERWRKKIHFGTDGTLADNVELKDDNVNHRCAEVGAQPLAAARLIVFARYPEPGRCKTRLIPGLGAEAAARVHRDMTRHTLDWARRLANQAVQVEVQYTGGSESNMRDVFGDDLRFVSQVAGDLGVRLRAAVEQAQSDGIDKVLLVGTDCPQLDECFASVALAELDRHALCVAPATDGGYTLLGLRTELLNAPGPTAALFDELPWGTDEVLRQTLQRLGGRTPVAVLPTLGDVDHPEDLHIWTRIEEGVRQPAPKLSVILPVLGDEPNLRRALKSCQESTEVEVIVVAAGDWLNARRIAVEEGAQFLVGPAQRAKQQNLGASRARAELLLFLHADTQLPDNYLQQVLQCFEGNEPETTVGGAFQLQIDSPRRAARLVERGVQLRSRWLQRPYGDQALFVRKPAFEQLGGFPIQPIMEDFVFVRQLTRLGRLTICDSRVKTSARRWHQLGFLRTTVINQLMIVGYHLGVSLERLARLYRRRDNSESK